MKFLNAIASDSSHRAFCVNWQHSSFRYKYLNETRVQIHAAHTKQMPHVVVAPLALLPTTLGENALYRVYSYTYIRWTDSFSLSVTSFQAI